MGDVFLSIRGRVLINVEALNMTESVGNYVKHRRVPVILPKEEYTTFFVPAISGEALAHGYQTVLAQEAEKKGLPVCKLCSQGIFLKSTNEEVFIKSFKHKIFPEKKESEDDIIAFLGISKEYWNNMVKIRDKMKKKKKTSKEEKEVLAEFEQKILPHTIEKKIIESCVVEDIGGFLYAERTFRTFEMGGVRRTSNFYTGYMIPVKESLEAVVIEPQLHSRYALGTPFVRAETRGQMIYYVELSSAPYTFAFDFDSSYVGKTTFVYEHAGDVAVEDRAKRINVALDALRKFILEFMFGAKKTRFLPVVEWESMVIAVSDDVWTVPSPFTVKYVENAKRKLEKISYNTKLHIYTKDSEKTLEEVVIEAINDAKERIEK